MKKKIFYWAPCLNKVGTVISSKNSAISLAKYQKRNYEVAIINACGEWDEYKKEIINNNIKLVNLTFSFHNILPKTGFLKSRISYLIIYLICFIPLVICLKKHKPDFMILHLITSLPLTILNIFSFKTKFVLRISGMPKLNFLRKLFWKYSSKNLYKITCPTQELLNKIISQKIFEETKLFYLQDAILNLDNFKNNFIMKPVLTKKKIILTAGRLTRQKNYNYLINEYNKFLDYSDEYDLVILGTGEKKKSLQDLVIKLGLNNRVHLKGRVENVYEYMKSAEVFVLTSLWEEMGFVIIEAAFNTLFIISSDCPNGPKEFIDGKECGLLFKSNSEGCLKNALIEFSKLNDNSFQRINAKKKSKNFTKFNHHNNLIKVLVDENKI